jgi:hypothetical protein
MISLKVPKLPKLIKTPRMKKMTVRAKTGPWSGGDVAPTFAGTKKLKTLNY